MEIAPQLYCSRLSFLLTIITLDLGNIRRSCQNYHVKMYTYSELFTCLDDSRHHGQNMFTHRGGGSMYTTSLRIPAKRHREVPLIQVARNIFYNIIEAHNIAL